MAEKPARGAQLPPATNAPPTATTDINTPPATAADPPLREKGAIDQAPPAQSIPAKPPAQDKPATSASPKRSSAAIKKDYDAILVKVQQAAKAGTLLRVKLHGEMESKIKEQAGDVENLKQQKRALTAELEEAKAREEREAAGKAS